MARPGEPLSPQWQFLFLKLYRPGCIGVGTRCATTPSSCPISRNTALCDGILRGRAGGGAGRLEPPTFGQIGPYLQFSLQTYPFKKTKRSQKRDIFRFSNAFPAIWGLAFHEFPGEACPRAPLAYDCLPTRVLPLPPPTHFRTRSAAPDSLLPSRRTTRGLSKTATTRGLQTWTTWTRATGSTPTCAWRASPWRSRTRCWRTRTSSATCSWSWTTWCTRAFCPCRCPSCSSSGACCRSRGRPSSSGSRWSPTLRCGFNKQFYRCILQVCPWLNPFTPKSGQVQISPAAPPVILLHIVWRTWLFIAYSDERFLCYQFSLPHLHISLLKGWENVLYELGSKKG